MPAWIADRRAIDSAHTGPNDTKTCTPGSRNAALTIAAEQPEWGRQLGDVPEDHIDLVVMFVSSSGVQVQAVGSAR